MEWSTEIVCAHWVQSVRSLQRIGNDFPSPRLRGHMPNYAWATAGPISLDLGPNQFRAFDHRLYLFERDIPG